MVYQEIEEEDAVRYHNLLFTIDANDFINFRSQFCLHKLPVKFGYQMFDILFQCFTITLLYKEVHR